MKKPSSLIHFLRTEGLQWLSSPMQLRTVIFHAWPLYPMNGNMGLEAKRDMWKI